MNNRRIGNIFEQCLARKLSDNGWWVHRLTQNHAGQPFDMIAAKNRQVYPIDAKVCSGDRFVLSRAEDNQINSMWLWRETGNGHGYFAILMCGEIYMLSFGMLELLKMRNVASITNDEMLNYALLLTDWMKDNGEREYQ